MTRTPDEIKEGLYWCSQHVDSMDCEKCPYYRNKDCVDNMCSDVAKLVQQLEAELEDMTARYKIADECAKKKGEMNEKLYAELTAVKAERDAAVRELEVVAEKVEQVDAYIDDYIHADVDYRTYLDARDMVDSIVNWEYESEWRGVQKEE